MRAALSVILLAALCLGDALAADKSPAGKKPSPRHENRVDYLGLPTGSTFGQFAVAHKGTVEKAVGNFLELENRSRTDFSYTLKRPKEFEGFDRFLRRIPVRIVNIMGADNCGMPLDAVFLGVPHDKGDRELLFSYSYVTCADDTLVTPGRFLDKYIEKYGMYDARDYDRGHHIYHNVQGRYEVRVKPAAGKRAMLIITVSDNAVFSEAYKAWRSRLRRAEETTRGKF